MKRIGLLIAVLAAFHATASSPQAWAESERAMRAACLKASGLKTPGWEGRSFTTVMTSAIRRCLSAGATRSRL